MIQLGSKVRDIYTGYTGIAVRRMECLYDGDLIEIELLELENGKPVKPHWFNEQRVEVLGDDAPRYADQPEPAST